ncbi:unnamed protein product [Rangifer tarandus platyrhynchus]|uniref:Uncharacterized protein n=1 Tax=Rangifer tarandus platyrhynchus TaxID=3082113 RepID=A0ABN8ZX35_RANTA|nr:unnamed protein product [Rangifer tarandus platyrhynchus]
MFFCHPPNFSFSSILISLSFLPSVSTSKKTVLQQWSLPQRQTGKDGLVLQVTTAFLLVFLLLLSFIFIFQIHLFLLAFVHLLFHPGSFATGSLNGKPKIA